MDITLINDVLNVKTSTTVKLYEYFSVTSEDGPIDLRVEVIADFEGIPEKYHEVLFNMLTAKYINKVSFGDNPFSECKPPKTKKWYQFWKK